MAMRLLVRDEAAQVLAAQLSENVNMELSVEPVYTPGKPLRVRRQGDRATVEYGRRVELFRGLSLLAQHGAEEAYEATQPVRFHMDGLMLDCSRNAVMKLPAVKKFIRYMAAMGLDTLMLYTEDTYQVPEYPYFGYLRGRYTADELRELDDYCASYGIELIPCIQTLAHLNQPMRWPCFDEVRDCNDILLCGEEKTYQFIEAMLRTCRSVFRTKRIHIGMDEALMMSFGKYRQRNEPEAPAAIFCRHLERVVELCEKYDFRPMIWSDMFFRTAFGGEYYGDGQIPQSIIDLVPRNVELVYWDYYHKDKAFYASFIEKHQKFPNRLLFAGASWRWLGYTPALEKSLAYSRSALDACLEKQVNEIFVTAWGDDGSEASFFTALPVMQLYAEYQYCGGATDRELADRLYACTGQHLADMLLLDLPNRPDGVLHDDIAVNPSKYLLYQDVLLGLMDYHTESCYSTNYASYVPKLSGAAARAGELGYVYDTAAKLCAVLAIKSRMGVELREAYRRGDTVYLRQAAEKTLPELLERVKVFHRAVAYQWEQENKIFGFEVLDVRLGGLEQRICSAISRLNGFVGGELASLPELEENILPCDSRTEEAADKVVCQNLWHLIYSASRT